MLRHPKAPTPSKSGKGQLHNVEVFNAEVVAIHNAVLELTKGKPHPVAIFSGNLAAIKACKYRPAPSSQKKALKVYKIVHNPQ